ncbi:hypothetical protein EDC04DRAFT_2896533 [Pisolithus marmoratus]|nr:hypothetical protein EDC04DRAFT_2896533 [Pisolithus marmoratus]
MSSIPYFAPDAVRAAIPGMWVANVKKLGVIMKEIPDTSAEEDTINRWPQEQIEQICKFAMDMSTDVPDYDKDTQVMIGAAYERLQVIQARFAPCMVKPKAKLTPVAPPPSQSSSDLVRQSQTQAWKPCPHVHLLLNPNEEASAPVSDSSVPPPPPPAPSAPLFLPSSTPNMPSQVPEPANIVEDLIEDMLAFSASPSSLLNNPEEVPVAVKSQEVEIELTSPWETPNVSPPPEREVGDSLQSSRSARWVYRRGQRALKESDAMIAGFKELIECSEDLLSYLYSWTLQVTSEVGTMVAAICSNKQQLQALKEWQERYIIMGP